MNLIALSAEGGNINAKSRLMLEQQKKGYNLPYEFVSGKHAVSASLDGTTTIIITEEDESTFVLAPEFQKEFDIYENLLQQLSPEKIYQLGYKKSENDIENQIKNLGLSDTTFIYLMNFYLDFFQFLHNKNYKILNIDQNLYDRSLLLEYLTFLHNKRHTIQY